GGSKLLRRASACLTATSDKDLIKSGLLEGPLQEDNSPCNAIMANNSRLFSPSVSFLHIFSMGKAGLSELFINLRIKVYKLYLVKEENLLHQWNKDTQNEDNLGNVSNLLPK